VVKKGERQVPPRRKGTRKGTKGSSGFMSRFSFRLPSILSIGIPVLIAGIVLGLVAGNLLIPERTAAPPRLATPQPERTVLPPSILHGEPEEEKTPPRPETEARSLPDELFAEEEPAPEEAAPTQSAQSAPPEKKTASLPPSPARPGAAWRKAAIPPPSVHGHALIVVIIDDMGVDMKQSARIMDLKGSLTLSFLPYAHKLDEQIAKARATGHELMVHLPMEPLNASVDPGPDALLTALPPAELERRIDANLSRFPGYVAINNHMGSKFTANEKGMDLVMAALHRRGLLFVDSMTSSQSVGMAAASRAGVPALARDVFLDNVPSVAAIETQLEKTEILARRKGAAIAIGHPRPDTVAALAAWLPTLEGKGLTLVPISALAERKLAGEKHAAPEQSTQTK